MASSSQSSAVGAEPDYGRVRDAFLQLYETPAAERAVRLRTLCGDDLALLREVERLLAESDSAGSFLLDPARFAATDTWSGGKQVPSRLPERIGRYAIRSVLGVGGMGVVYLAEQDNPRRTVALKVLRPSLTTPRARSRFAWEAHVLARLHHPGIAQVFEAGEADTGEGPQSFFAMELVEGRSLVEHAEANKLDARARVALLAEVGDAVHHAHQRGIIHCDLKPSNILVDGSGRPKVLDFGIARAASTDQTATLATMVTSVGVLAGTLPYMSPEQTSADVDQIDVRSDVYALGVVAFECLTGRLPHDLAGKNLLAALQTVRDGEPIRLAAVAPALRGDLDTIVMHALAKDRGQRYAAASEFAADLRRYLRDEPIAARPPSGLHSLRKLAARHRGLVVGIATAFFVLAGSLIWTSVLLARTTSAEQLATRSADFMKGTLSRFNPIRIGAEVKLADVLEHMRTELAFPDAPTLEADLRLSLAQAFQAFGRYDLCEQTIRPAIEIRRRLLGDEHADTLACRSALVLALVSAERFTEVLPEARTIKASLTRQFGLDHGRTLPARLSLGRALLEAGSYAEARVELEATVAAAAHTLPEDDRLHLGAVQSLARLQRVFGDLADAEAGLRLVLDAYERTLGPEHSDYLLTALTLTSLLAEDLRRFADARDILQTVLPTAQRVLGEDNPNTLAMKQGLGHAHAGLGQTAEAEPLIREALAGFLRTEGPRHTRTLRCQATLAELLMQKGDLAAAKETLQELLAIATAELEPTHDLVLTQQNNLAVLQWKLGETAEALAQMRQVVEGRKQGFGEAHRYTCLVESNLSAFLVNLGQLPEAEARLTSRCRDRLPLGVHGTTT